MPIGRDQLVPVRRRGTGFDELLLIQADGGCWGRLDLITGESSQGTSKLEFAESVIDWLKAHPEVIWTPFGARLTEMRTVRGISIGELARRLCHSKKFVERIEAGEYWPTRDFARLVDAALDGRGDCQ